MPPTERAYRLIRTVIHRSYLPGERFMNRDESARTFEIGTKEAAVCRLVAEGLLTGPRGRYVNEYSPDQQRRRVRQLRERASDLRREALELINRPFQSDAVTVRCAGSAPDRPCRIRCEDVQPGVLGNAYAQGNAARWRFFTSARTARLPDAGRGAA